MEQCLTDLYAFYYCVFEQMFYRSGLFCIQNLANHAYQPNQKKNNKRAILCLNALDVDFSDNVVVF